MHVAVAAIRELFHNPNDAFWTGRALDLLFNGIEIDCSTKNALGRLACSEIRNGKHQVFRPINNELFVFSLFGGVCSVVFLHFFDVFCR